MPCPCRTVERSGDVEVVVVCLFEGTALCAQFLVSATRHRSHFSVDIPTTRCKRSVGFHNHFNFAGSHAWKSEDPPLGTLVWGAWLPERLIVKTDGSFAASGWNVNTEM